MVRSVNEGNVCSNSMVVGYFDIYIFFGYNFLFAWTLESCLHCHKEVVSLLFNRSHQDPLQRNGMVAIPNNS